MSIFENRTDEHSQKVNDANDYAFFNFEDESQAMSPAIPLPKSHIRRTESESNLTENLRLAEFRDQCMFNRLVNGIQKQQQLLYNAEFHDTRLHDFSSSPSSSRRRSTRHRKLEGDADKGSRHRRRDSSNSNAMGGSGYNAESQVISSRKILFEENEKSIESIVSTRQRPVTFKDVSLSSSPPAKNQVLQVITDDEDSDSPIFEMEI